MPYLTINPSKDEKKDSIPIAIIKGDDKKYNNKLLYLNQDENKSGNHQIKLPIGCTFNILPSVDENTRNIYYIAGASGSGKSYISKIIATNYKKLYPDRPIYCISKLTKDETLDQIPDLIRIDLDEFTSNHIDINDFSDSMVIFDDYETITPKKKLDAVMNFMDDIAIMGRKHQDGQGNISMMVLNHHITNYKKTRLILNEASHYILYPQSTSSSQLGYLLKSRLGFDKNEIRELKKLGRWVCIHKNYIQYMISAHYAKILNID